MLKVIIVQFFGSGTVSPIKTKITIENSYLLLQCDYTNTHKNTTKGTFFALMEKSIKTINCKWYFFVVLLFAIVSISVDNSFFMVFVDEIQTKINGGLILVMGVNWLCIVWYRGIKRTSTQQMLLNWLNKYRTISLFV